jgi:glutaredoxin-like protein
VKGRDAQIVVYGTAWCADCVRSKRLLDRYQVRYEWVDIDKERSARDLVVKLNAGKRIVPTIVFPDGTVMAEPSDRELAAKLGLTA